MSLMLNVINDLHAQCGGYHRHHIHIEGEYVDAVTEKVQHEFAGLND